MTQGHGPHVLPVLAAAHPYSTNGNDRSRIASKTPIDKHDLPNDILYFLEAKNLYYSSI